MKFRVGETSKLVRLLAVLLTVVRTLVSADEYFSTGQSLLTALQ